MSGTSMAAPHVAGAAAQLRAARPEFDASQTTTALLCMSTSNAISGLPGASTANRFLYAGAAMAERETTSCNFPPSPPSPPPPPPSPPGACTESCNYSRDGDCDDGGEGAEFTYCQLGTDCYDCGNRMYTPPSPVTAQPPSPSRSPPSPRPPSGGGGGGGCSNTCRYARDT